MKVKVLILENAPSLPLLMVVSQSQMGKTATPAGQR